MAVRVRLRLRTGAGEVLSAALVNSGFEADTPQLVVPIALARRLDLWGRALVEGRIQV